jgi:hypothetical protein
MNIHDFRAFLLYKAGSFFNIMQKFRELDLYSVAESTGLPTELH